MKKDEVKLVYIRAGREEEAYLRLEEQNINCIFDAVKRLFDLGCKSISVESQDFSLFFDYAVDGGKSITGRFKQGFTISK